MSSQSYVYHTPKTGTSQDLMTVITKAYERHLAAEGLKLPAKPSSQRMLLEAPFVLAGKLVACGMRVLPAEAALSVHDKLYASLSAPKSYPFDAASPALRRAGELAASLERETGRAPALVALISHPPVLGDLAHMNFELVRHATLALRQVRGRACRPRLVVAIDPFALDTASLLEEGLYAGFMGTYHLGFDRLSLTRGAASGFFLRRAAWHAMAQRFLEALRSGGEVGMVLAGGVPSTTRVLYAIREWVGEARREGRPRREDVLRRLRALPGFAELERSGPHGERLKGSAWRLAELYAMSALAGVFIHPKDAGRSCADLGALDEGGRAAMLQLLGALGLEGECAVKSLSLLNEELCRETPYRRRFFRVLAGRVGKTRPVVVLPIVHRAGDKPGIEIREARRVPGSNVEAFAVQFVRENFS